MPDRGDDDSLPPALAFLADREAFLRRYVLSLVLAPPPSRRRMPPLSRAAGPNRNPHPNRK